MQQPEELLQLIRRVPVDEQLYTQLEQRIAQRKKITISSSWLRAAAVLAFMLLSTEAYFLAQHIRQPKHQPMMPSIAYNPAFDFSYE
ncbi:MAG: hypothetical protein JNM95_00365 [Chitinophagaceae bacterium]|nr:hypothetical protein [Chitinophagaceae bacterium]